MNKTNVQIAHSGDLGDIIYAMPFMAEYLRGVPDAEIVLYPSNLTRERMTPGRAGAMIRLLETLKPSACRYVELLGPEHVNIDVWRGRQNAGVNLSDAQQLAMRMWPLWPHDKPWINVPRWAGDVPRVLFARSTRYLNEQFPWEQCLEQCGNDIGFVGTADEHRLFQMLYGVNIQHVSTPDLYALALMINKCELFIGNESAPRAIAEGLKKPCVVCEVNNYGLTFFRRPGAVYSRDMRGTRFNLKHYFPEWTP